MRRVQTELRKAINVQHFIRTMQHNNLSLHRLLAVRTSNLGKAHVTRDSSGPAIWQSVCSNNILMRLEKVL